MIEMSILPLLLIVRYRVVEINRFASVKPNNFVESLGHRISIFCILLNLKKKSFQFQNFALSHHFHGTTIYKNMNQTNEVMFTCRQNFVMEFVNFDNCCVLFRF